MTIIEVLNALGFEDGWAADHAAGIIVWTRNEPQPTEEELIAAGWDKSNSQNKQESSTE